MQRSLQKPYLGKALRRASIAGAIGCWAGTSFAQSSVTLYGLIDSGLRYTTNADKAGDSRWQTMSGGASESHFGIKGSEDLGGGLSAIFQLEDRFFTNSGTTDPAYPFFNTAFVGLQSTTYGRLTLGRQLNPFADAVMRTYITNPWLPTVYQFRPEVGMAQGVWTSSMAKYAAQWHDVTVEGSYAFGTTGAFGAGSQIGASIAYVPQGPVSLAAGYLDARDAVNGSAHFKAWTAGGTYTFDSTRFSLGWAENREDPGFTGNFPNGPYTTATLTALKFNNFTERTMIFGGVTQTVGAATHLSANVWRTLQEGKQTSGDGNATQFQLMADYNLSRRTDVYIEGDYAWYSGGLIGAQIQGFNGLSAAQGSTQLGAMVGIRHLF
ncbi:porin [Pararobbsia silviterrae]|uniref:Porin n=1 Tax=Pararobbsia silviterrae TaxID=1792498 RepID=A0A494Y428_9BURK|nr:porin [Pararobbsia silviterrae]RKP56778.1 porin [Pararobbsia silviterrae]